MEGFAKEIVNSWYILSFLFFFSSSTSFKKKKKKTGSCYAAQANPKLVTLLPQSPNCWDHKHVTTPVISSLYEELVDIHVSSQEDAYQALSHF